MPGQSMGSFDRSGQRGRRIAGFDIVRVPVVIIGLAGGLLLLPHCAARHALLLAVESSTAVGAFDLRITNIDSAEVVLDQRDERIIAPATPNRDISKPGEALRLAVEFAGPGRYLVHLVGRESRGDGLVVAIRAFHVSGVQRATVRLMRLENDTDGDRFPACAAYSDCSALVETFSCEYLDCDDSDPKVHPFGTEVCGNGKDDDCSTRCGSRPGPGDEPCEDGDGDGVPASQDCDDRDPCRSPLIVEAKNLCRVGDGGLPGLPQACLDQLAAEGREATPPFCGDGVDQDCNGRDVVCVVDEDCDQFSPPEDCDDTSAAINRQAPEVCDGTDNNCDGVVDEGCVPCDVDGDGHAAFGSTDPDCDLPKDDPDDYDSGVHPGTTADSGGAEGGTVLGALRRFCATDLNRAGVAQRDIDHDGDESAAKDDGCPSVDCDADGDGFARSGCGDPAPLPTKADCDDTDAHVFPGAPDYCGDGIAQNCLADDCAADQDGDGYATPGDCNDDPNDPVAASIHPWATEICDGVDNDCDGLIDEGNPDDQGNLIATSVPLCSDSNVGQCAPCPADVVDCGAAEQQLTGTCACSRQTPVRTSGPGSQRVACAGEDEIAVASQRCFGANQPLLERCDLLDWNCDGQPNPPEGQNLADSGRICGVERGTCGVGKVTGCDLSRAVSDEEQAVLDRVLGADYNPHWRCQDEDGNDVVLPIAELCNGRDDDCDGNVPPDELDSDGDNYLACHGCTDTAVTGPHALVSPDLRCGDCDSADPAVHPDAAELCNGLDDNCFDGSNDDGANECTTAAAPDCCSGPGSCVNLQNDFYNCRDCGHVCDANVTNRCDGGVCVCGSTGGPCTSGKCDTNGTCCTGCLDPGNNNSCQQAPTVALCGVGGSICKSCELSSGDCRNNPGCSATGECTFGVKNAKCYIDGVCRTNQQVNPDTSDPNHECEWCKPDTDARNWSPKTGNSCNGGAGTCADGICVPNAG